MPQVVLRAWVVLVLVHDFCKAAQYTAVPRWGQATALVDNMLFVQGGRTDQYNEYAYSSAPPNNDMLALSLSSSFNLSLSPWEYISGCSNCSSSQGPAVAWHTMSPVNTSCMLLFGGDLGPNSAITVPEGSDSAGLVNIEDVLSPIWDTEADSWADEPLRRMYHSASSIDGKVYIIGGQKTDGSGDAFSTHYMFDPTVPSFTELPSSNGPPGIYGHASVVLPDGRLIVFGGYDQSGNTLVPFSTIWSLDTTQSTLAWTTLSVSTTSLPSSRRGFAATLVDGGKVLIQGGADAGLDTSFSDGWVLDTTKSPMVWNIVDALSELGPRRDHFAVGLGSQVLFGFGYATNGPATAALSLFDVSSSSWSSSYTPPSSIISPTVTTLSGPAPTNPSGTNGPLNSGQPTGGSGSGSGGGSGTGTGLSPIASGSGNGNGSGSGSGNGSGSGSGSGSGGADGASSSHSHHATSIALGTVFGVLGLLVGTSAAVWYLRRQHSRDSFHALGPSDDDDDAALPIAGSREKGLSPMVQNVKTKLGMLVPGIAPIPPQQRRDILADEDTREFDTPWYAFSGVRRDASSGGSSWNSGLTRRPTLGDMVHESLASLRSVGGTMLAYAAGTRGVKSREASGGSRSSTAWWEKERAYEPYSDDTALIGDGDGSIPAHAARPRGGRQPSHATVASSFTYHEDPFADYEVEEFKTPPEDLDLEDDDIAEQGFPTLPSLSDPPPRPYAYIRAPAATVDLTRLSPVSERPSIPTISNATLSDISHVTFPTPITSASDPSRSSHETSRSPRPRPSSIIDANPPPTEPMRRSNSWWTRFSKTPLLERRSSDASRRQKLLEFRDPNPPPRLIPIEESTHSNPGESPPSRAPSGHRHMYSSTQHGRSASSLQTARTANSEMIEKMGRTMDIVQKSTMNSHSSAPSMDSADDDGVRLDSSLSAPTGRPLPPVFSSSSSSEDSQASNERLRNLVQSPEEMTSPEAAHLNFPSPPVSPRSSPPRRPTSGQVSARVQAYERRMSQQQESARPEPSGRAKQDRASMYGIAPKPSLFVANPDHKSSPSTDSTSSS